MRSFKEYCELRPLFEDNSLPTAGFFAEYVEARENDLPLNEFFGLGGLMDRLRGGTRPTLPTYRVTRDPSTGKKAYKEFEPGDFMPNKMPGMKVPARMAPRQPMGAYTDKPVTPDLEVINQPVKIKPEKLMQYVKSSGVDVSKIPPAAFDAFVKKINSLPTRDEAMDEIRTKIRQMLLLQGKYTATGRIA